MAQQTINVGTAPNDGTGTPLRTAFQYTNSNFSELYTAVGPSGNNIVVPGNATITGDLTVDTSTLKVDSALNKVGVGVATLTGLQTFNVAGDVGITSDLVLKNSGGTVQGYIFGSSGLNYRVIAGQPHVWQEGGSDLMRLNSTGLGVGVVPSAGKFEVQESGTGAGIGGIFASTASGGGNPGVVFRTASTNRWSLSLTGSAGAESIRFYDINNSATRLLIDSSGNVGIGVAPSAWGANYKAFQIGAQSCLYNALGYITSLNTNAYENSSGQIVRIANGEGTRYVQAGGSHQWFYAANASAGTIGGFTQAMTLDASGNLLVGKTAASVMTVGFQTLANGEASTAMASSTGSASVWNAYSTGAAAYRFYVAMNGTISATNTTISAISDARLKENVQDIDVGLGAILALKPRKFDWKAGKGKDIKGDRGFIAQEFEQVFPNLIDEWKDPAPAGEAPYKSVRQDLIPVLVKAIQELAARVQTLETR